MSLDEAARQLKLAVHDAQVAFDCLGLGDLERAHEHAITARAAMDAATLAVQEAQRTMTPEEATREGEHAVAALEE
ncbi:MULTISPECIES: hypothetical protein [Thermomonospora]|uniref:Uncharacterized protein n=1 Tax=Thermomonospora cellulosilytica TaxID=1411118 RepID=A0A7W3MXA7_9ACTN|nr:MULTISPECIES: hypothetical protein [Thermomonospora]MBA9003639.1 hypothetical protein [Thermomonospora cellulosilytica]